MAFTLFQNFIQYTHNTWKTHVKQGDYVLDATCGNGHDSLILAQLALTDYSGKLIVVDLQKQAIEATKNRLTSSISTECMQRITFQCTCHSKIDALAEKDSLSLIVYNLGYLPNGDQMLTTLVESTKISILKSLELLKPGGLLSIMCYPGHEEGAFELEALHADFKMLDPKKWACTFHAFTNRNKSPCLFLIQKDSEFRL